MLLGHKGSFWRVIFGNVIGIGVLAQNRQIPFSDTQTDGIVNHCTSSTYGPGSRKCIVRDEEENWGRRI